MGGNSDDVFQVGPWRVDVRQKVEGEVKLCTDGQKELERYIHMAKTFNEDDSGLDGSIYLGKLKDLYSNKRRKTGTCSCEAKSGEPFGWGCFMTVVRLGDAGCLIYSPVLDDRSSLDKVTSFLQENQLLPVAFVLAP